MATNDELTVQQLRQLLEDNWPGMMLSLSTVKWAWRDLGRIATRLKYCHIILEVNQAKCKLWCEERLHDGDKFGNVNFTDK